MEKKTSETLLDITFIHHMIHNLRIFWNSWDPRIINGLI